MNKVWLVMLLCFFLGIITVVGDILIKEATLRRALTGWPWLLAGGLIYGLTAIGWFYVMRQEELSIIGALYAVTVVIALFFVGALFYKEKITAIELVGLALGLASIAILFRFG